MAEISVGIQCLKYILYIANFIYMLTGFICFLMGIILKNQHYKGEVIASTALIVVGVVTFATAFVGCCGASRESVCLYGVFSISLLAILIIEMGLGMHLYLNTDDTIDQIMVTTWKDQATEREYWDVFEREQQCCGHKGASDYGRSIPDTCCNTPPCTTVNAFSNGCLAEFRHKYAPIIKSISAGLIGHAIITLLEFILTLIVGHRIWKSKNEAAES